jgi:hypothetical protein
VQRSLQRMLAAYLHVSIGPHDEQPISPRLMRDMSQELEAGAVGPVEIVQKQGDRRMLRKRAQEAGNRPEQAVLGAVTRPRGRNGQALTGKEGSKLGKALGNLSTQ